MAVPETVVELVESTSEMAGLLGLGVPLSPDVGQSVLDLAPPLLDLFYRAWALLLVTHRKYQYEFKLAETSW